jgi:hypothetical protein
MPPAPPANSQSDGTSSYQISASPPQLYSPSAQYHHPAQPLSPVTGGHQLYSNVLNPATTLTNLGYSTAWHSNDYAGGFLQSTYHYQTPEYIPLISELR